MPSPPATPAPVRRNCRDCQQYQLSANGPRCSFRGGRPAGICAVFKRRIAATTAPEATTPT